MTGAPEAVLEAARIAAGMSTLEVWLDYFALGGTASLAVVGIVFNGALVPGDGDYDLLPDALKGPRVD